MKRLFLLVIPALMFFSFNLLADETKNGCWHLYEKGEKEVGYCQAYRSGDTLHISGSIGVGEMSEAIKQAYGDLQKTLEAHGLGFEHVVKETVFATDLDAFIANKEVRKTFYGETFPAASWVQVERLYTPALVLEVELTAVFPRP